MSNSWIDHVKAYAKKHNLKYNEALKKAGPSFKKSKGSTAKTTAKGKAAKSTTKKGNVRKTAKGDMPGSRLAYDDTKQEKDKKKKK
jgi:hypothetical protein